MLLVACIVVLAVSICRGNVLVVSRIIRQLGVRLDDVALKKVFGVAPIALWMSRLARYTII